MSFPAEDHPGHRRHRGGHAHATGLGGLHFIERSVEQEFTQRARATIKAFTVTTKDAVIASDLASLQSFVQGDPELSGRALRPGAGCGRPDTGVRRR